MKVIIPAAAKKACVYIEDTCILGVLRTRLDAKVVLTACMSEECMCDEF